MFINSLVCPACLLLILSTIQVEEAPVDGLSAIRGLHLAESCPPQAGQAASTAVRGTSLWVAARLPVRACWVNVGANGKEET